MKSPHRARAFGAVLALLLFFATSTALAQAFDRGGEGIPAEAAPTGSPDALQMGPIPAPTTKSVADGLYMDGIWNATYGSGYSTITLTLPYIYNNRSYTSGSLRLSYWALTYYPVRGEGITGYRLATFPTWSGLAPYYYYYNIVTSAAMTVPPNGTYWLVLVLEEYDPAHCPQSSSGFCLADDTVSFEQRTFGPVTANLSLSQSVTPNPANVGKDLVFNLAVTNSGPATATNVVLSDSTTGLSTYLWAPPACAGTSAITCTIGSIAPGATVPVQIVVRPTANGTITNFATVSATEFDPSTADNSSSVSVAVVTPPIGVPVLRYRLYSPISLEHHFTTDLNEYSVLGASGSWIQEGTIGKVLNNPGSVNGVAAVPYYRLYNTATRWHHWTTDSNEYYTLGLFPTWNQEGVDGYILPTFTTGATQLFRLLYPNGTGLHHWTVDPTEFSILIATYGWIGEGGTGYVLK